MPQTTTTTTRTVYKVTDGFRPIAEFSGEAEAEAFAERATDITMAGYDVQETQEPLGGAHHASGEFAVVVEGQAEHRFGDRRLAEACAAVIEQYGLVAAEVRRTEDWG
jgi:hypothetical protein